MSATSWAEFATAAPELASEARRLLERSGIGEGLLATVRDGALPRVHPVYVGFAAGRLVTFVAAGSGKDHDLAVDGRFALHAHQDPVAPHELLVRGRASPVKDPALFAIAAGGWTFEVTGHAFRLYELDVERVLLGERAVADAWPPVYRSWRAAGPP